MVGLVSCCIKTERFLQRKDNNLVQYLFTSETDTGVSRGTKSSDLNRFVMEGRQQQLLVTRLKICPELVQPLKILSAIKCCDFGFFSIVSLSHHVGCSAALLLDRLPDTQLI